MIRLAATALCALLWMAGCGPRPRATAVTEPSNDTKNTVPDRFSEQRESLTRAVPGDDAARMARIGHLEFVMLEEDVGLGPRGFPGEQGKALLTQYGANVVRETKTPESEGHRLYIEMLRVYAEQYNREIRKHQEAQRAHQAEIDGRVAKYAALENKFTKAGCVRVSMVKVTKRNKGEYVFSVRVETQGDCLKHDGQRCQRHETLYSYEPGGLLLDPQGIFRDGHNDLVGIDISDPDQPQLAGSRDRPLVPTKLRTSRKCNRLFDAMNAVGDM